jgi:hypothetical protein
MGLIDVTHLLDDGLYNAKYDALMEWLEQCCGPRTHQKRTPDKNGIIPLCQSSNWRLFAISYSVRRAYPDTKFQSSGWVLEFDQDADLLMFTLRWN